MVCVGTKEVEMWIKSEGHKHCCVPVYQSGDTTVRTRILLHLTKKKILGQTRNASPRVHLTDVLPTEHVSLFSAAVYLVI